MWARLRSALAPIFALTYTTGCAHSPTEPTEPITWRPPLENGRDLTTKLYQHELDALWARFAPPLRDLFGSVRGLASFRAQIDADAGQELRVLSENVTPWIGSDLYARTAEFQRMSRVIVQWSLEPSGLANALLIEPLQEPAVTKFADYHTRATLRLPFSGDWFVFWGGRDVVDNVHAVASDQRFASDFVVLQNGKNFTGDGSRNEQYHCFGQPVLAPASGTVVAAEDSITDNRPGKMNASRPLGNHVIIDHSDGEFSFLAHLQKGSLSVSSGDAVHTGSLLGRCGNSGNSSEPHVHYHLQNTKHFANGEGLPAQFTNYMADGILVERGEPRRGQRVTSKP